MQLDRKIWTIGTQLPDGEGGFGKVFDVVDEVGHAGVAKFVEQEPGADRELLMGDSIRAAGASNVVPVWDTGEHDGQWVIVMPKAETSLLAHMRRSRGPIPMAEAVDILTDVATALSDLAAADPAIVHRDLKPGNVLRLNGCWCLADFGIARYAEATTAIDTRKWNLTKPYAAPEQWRLERATPATDVYALGVMAYELLAGSRPFGGPDFRQQHLAEPAPALSTGTPRLRTLVEECLYKAPSARPSANNIVARLQTAIQQATAPGASRLAQANSRESDRLSRDYAEAVRRAEDEATNASLFQVAEQSFETIADSLLGAIQADAPLALTELRVGNGAMLFVARLRHGKVGISRPTQSADWTGPFRVVADAFVSVEQSRNSSGYEGRVHSLWFCDAHEAGRFAWYETAFMDSPLLGVSQPHSPYALVPGNASGALSNVMGTKQLAWPFEELDRGDLTEFVDRWLGWFADASERAMQYPSTMPEKPTGNSYRRS
jgi:serine/threonine-protein kinase